MFAVPRPSLGPWSRLAVQLLAVAFIVVLDQGVYTASHARLVEAAIDLPLHLLTALIVLSALRFRPWTPFWNSTALASVLIDLDHIPGELGYRFLTYGEPRPYTHSLLFAGCFVLCSLRLAGTRQQIVRGIGVGIVLHLLRDVVDGAVPLFWPVLTRGVGLPYLLYAVALLILALLGVVAAPASYPAQEDPAAPPERHHRVA